MKFWSVYARFDDDMLMEYEMILNFREIQLVEQNINIETITNYKYFSNGIKKLMLNFNRDWKIKQIEKH